MVRSQYHMSHSRHHLPEPVAQLNLDLDDHHILHLLNRLLAAIYAFSCGSEWLVTFSRQILSFCHKISHFRLSSQSRALARRPQYGGLQTCLEHLKQRNRCLSASMHRRTRAPGTAAYNSSQAGRSTHFLQERSPNRGASLSWAGSSKQEACLGDLSPTASTPLRHCSCFQLIHHEAL